MYNNFNLSRGCHEDLEKAVLGSGDDAVKGKWGLEGYPLASVYAPLQKFDKLYDEKTAHKKGTLFSELDLPFEGESVWKGGLGRG